MSLATEQIARCRSCGTEILWATTESGKRMPLDVNTEKRMTVVRIHDRGDPVIRWVPVYTSHFASCPQGDQWRKD